LDLVGRTAIATSANFGSGNYLEMGGRNGDSGKIKQKKGKTLLNRRGTYDLLPLAGMLYHGPIGEVCEKMCLQRMTRLLIRSHGARVGQLVEHRAVTREVVSSTPARPTLRVLK